MDQERVVMQIGRAFFVTGEYLMRSLYLFYDRTSRTVQNQKSQKVAVGETRWQAFLASAGRKEVKAFLATELNLDKLKTELEKYRLGFSFYKHGDGRVTMAYSADNRALVEQAFSDLLQTVVTTPGELKAATKKQTRQLTPPEKMAAFRNNSAKMIEDSRQQLLAQAQSQAKMADLLAQTQKVSQGGPKL